MAKLTAKSVEAKLKQFAGNISAVARAHDVARSSVQDFIQRRPHLVQVLKDSRETLVDNAESALTVAVTTQEQWAVKFVLLTLGKDRGYTERKELTGADGQPLNPPVVVYLPDNGRTQTTEEDDSIQAHDD